VANGAQESFSALTLEVRVFGGLYSEEKKLQTRVDRLTLQSEYAEDTLVRESKRLTAYETFKRFDSQSELSAGKGALRADSARAQSLKIRRNKVFGPVDNAEILGTSTLDRWLGNASATFSDEVQRLYYHSLPAR
jgi:hypothetical protein